MYAKDYLRPLQNIKERRTSRKYMAHALCPLEPHKLDSEL